MFYGRPNTIKAYTSLYRNWIQPYVESGDIKGNFLPDLMFKLQGYKPRTIKAVLRVLDLVLQDQGLPTEKVKKVLYTTSRSSQEDPPKALTFEEASAIMRVCKEERPEFYPIMLLGLHGLRRGEIFGLKWKDIALESRSFVVCRSYDGQPTKNGKSRKIPMTGELEKVLRTMYNSDREANLFSRVFNPNHAMKSICIKAGVRPVSIHSLRHTASVLALESGLSPKIVQSILGHVSVKTTLDTYWSAIIEFKDLDMSFLP